jgi:hypothetical protein
MRISFVTHRNAGGAVTKIAVAAELSTAICDRVAITPTAPYTATAATT